MDWDDLSRGDGSYDQGRLMAHLIFVAMRRGSRVGQVAAALALIQRGYADVAGSPMDRDLLRWQVAVALVQRAKISALRMLPPTWVNDVTNSVEEAVRILDNRSAWLEHL